MNQRRRHIRSTFRERKILLINTLNRIANRLSSRWPPLFRQASRHRDPGGLSSQESLDAKSWNQSARLTAAMGKPGSDDWQSQDMAT